MTQKTIEDILKRNGPQRSSKVVRELMHKNKITKEIAVKQVSRARNPVKKVKGMLPKNEVFLYVDSKDDKIHHYPFLYTNLLETRSVYGVILSAIISRGGIVRQEDFVTISGCPYALKKQVTASIAKNKLLHHGLLYEKNDVLLGPVLEVTSDLVRVNDAFKIRARMMTEELLLCTLKRWAENNNFAAHNRTKIRGDGLGKRMVGQFSWDLAAPCYLRSIFAYKDKNIAKEEKTQKMPGFFVCDVFLEENIRKIDILYFLKKILIYENTSNSGKLLPMFVGTRFSKEAFDLCRSNGIITTTPENLLGHVFAKELREVQRLLSDLPDETNLGAFIKGISKYYTSFSNLRGFTFELITVHILRLDKDANVSHSKKISVDVGRVVERAEIDAVSVMKNNVVRFIECKSTERGKLVRHEEVLGWKKKTEKIKKWIKLPQQQSVYSKLDVVFEIWTNSDFTDESKKVLKKMNMDSVLYEWKNGYDILSLARGYENTKSIIDSLQQFFIKIPKVQKST